MQDVTPFPFAVPSWVMQGNIAENCQFIAKVSQAYGRQQHHNERGAGKVAESVWLQPVEIGLCFFEAQSCLAYDEKDLPPSLADLACSWHVHLPLDLPWEEGGESVAATAARLMEKAAYLGAERAVLHPPVGYADAETLLQSFMSVWTDKGHAAEALLLENINGCDLIDLVPFIEQSGCRICLDTGHLFAYGQERLLACSALLRRVALVHLNAPGPAEKRSRHLPLTALTPHELQQVQCCLDSIPEAALLMLELFDWQSIEESLPVLERLLYDRGK